MSHKRSPITSHILDISRGKPAVGVPVTLEFKKSEKEWTMLGDGTSNADGRLEHLLTPETHLHAGIYRITFNTETYFNELNVKSFYPYATVAFEVASGEHYHIPLLLSPFGYSTYRGT